MKKLCSVLIIVVLISIALEILLDSPSILNTVRFSFNIWYNNIFPSLFPFFVLSDLLINFGFVELLGELFKPIMTKVFKINSNAAFVFIMSLISGFPSNAIYTKELVNNKMINEEEATKILTFTHFSNPLFIIGTIATLFLNNLEAGILILVVHYSSNIIIGLIFRNYYISKKEDTSFSIKKAINKMHERRISNKLPFGSILSKSLTNAMNTLFLILGVVTLFLIITTIIDNNLNVNSYHQSLINGFFEMTQGLKYVSSEPIPLKLKTLISGAIISFGGLSVHLQVISIISGTKIKYLPFLIGRFFHTALTLIGIYLLFDYWFN